MPSREMRSRPGAKRLRTHLVDAMSMKQYRGTFPGTYQYATANEKLEVSDPHCVWVELNV